MTADGEEQSAGGAERNADDQWARHGIPAPQNWWKLRCRWDAERLIVEPGGTQRGQAWTIAGMLVAGALGMAAAGTRAWLGHGPMEAGWRGTGAVGFLVAFIGGGLALILLPRYWWPLVLEASKGQLAIRGAARVRPRRDQLAARQVRQLRATPLAVRVLFTCGDQLRTREIVVSGDAGQWLAAALAKVAGVANVPDAWEADNATLGPQGLSYGIGAVEQAPLVSEAIEGGGVRVTVPASGWRRQGELLLLAGLFGAVGALNFAEDVLAALTHKPAPGTWRVLGAIAGLLALGAWWRGRRSDEIEVSRSGVRLTRRAPGRTTVRTFDVGEVTGASAHHGLVFVSGNGGRGLARVWSGKRASAAAIAATIRQAMGVPAGLPEKDEVTAAWAPSEMAGADWEPSGRVRFSRHGQGWRIERPADGWRARAVALGTAVLVILSARWLAAAMTAGGKARGWLGAGFIVGLIGMCFLIAWGHRVVRLWAAEEIAFDGETLRVRRPTLLGAQRFNFGRWFVTRLDVRTARGQTRELWLRLKNGRRMRVLSGERERDIRWAAQRIAQSVGMRAVPLGGGADDL